MKKLKESAGVSHLPEEIIQEILLILPIKSLCKFRAVCKSWNRLVSTSNFIQRHSLKSHSQHMHHQILLIRAIEQPSSNSTDVLCLHYDSPPFDKCTNNKLQDPFIAHNRRALLPQNRIDIKNSSFFVLGDCNGIVCLGAREVDDYYTLILWNPCIRKIVTLPRPRRSSTYKLNYSFGYDSSTNDYKVLRIEKSGTKTSVEIWSLAQPSSWKSLAVDYPIDLDNVQWCHRPAVFLRGALHLLHYLEGKANCIVSFDMSSELFGEPMILPEALTKGLVSMTTYRNSLIFIDSTTNYPQSDIWVMKKYGVVDSITKLLTTEIPETTGLSVRLVGFRNNGEAVIDESRVNSKDKLLNLMTNHVVGDFETPNPGYHIYVTPFQESLALLDHPNAISS